MDYNLKSLIETQLKQFEKIKFNTYLVTKGCISDIEIGENKNEKCGEIFDLLQVWLGYGRFIEYIIENGGYGNFHGEILLEDNEIVIYLTINGGDIFEEEEKKYIYLEEEFILDELKIELASIGMDDCFEESELILDFYKEKNKPFEYLSLYYFDKERADEKPEKSPYAKGWHLFELNESQLEILSKFIEEEIQDHMPPFNVDFYCETEWSVQCSDKELRYYVHSSPIRFELNDLIDIDSDTEDNEIE